MKMLKDGITLMHEHVTIDLSRLKNEDAKLKNLEATVAEFKQLYQNGVRNIVDVTNIGMGRDVNFVNQVAKASKINIIQATGFYQDKFLPDFVTNASVDQLANIMIDELTKQIENTNTKAQIIGEIGTSFHKMTKNEEKVFKAAVIAHFKTGAKITTHCTLGTYALEQIAFFRKHNVQLSNVMIGHTDLICEYEYILKILESGVFIEFDTIGKNEYMSDLKRIEILKQLENTKYSSKICLSLDITRNSHLKCNGGIGYNYLFDTFIPLCRKNNISEKFLNQMLVSNPKNFLEGSKNE